MSTSHTRKIKQASERRSRALLAARRATADRDAVIAAAIAAGVSAIDAAEAADLTRQAIYNIVAVQESNHGTGV